jgi:hypothetical protein
VGRAWWEVIIRVFSGKDVAVLGPRAAGKTTLFDFLVESDRASGPYTPTLTPKNTDWYRNTKIGVTIEKGVDVPGKESAYPFWQQAFGSADFVFYLFDAHRLRTVKGYRVVVLREARLFKTWGTEGKRVMMIGTHADVDPHREEIGDAAYHDLITDITEVAAFRTFANVKGIDIGSMTTGDSIQQMVLNVLGKS